MDVSTHSFPLPVARAGGWSTGGLQRGAFLLAHLLLPALQPHRNHRCQASASAASALQPLAEPGPVLNFQRLAGPVAV
jgi:hypothetical protein